MIFPVWEKCKSKPSSGQWLREPGEGVGGAGGGKVCRAPSTQRKGQQSERGGVGRVPSAEGMARAETRRDKGSRLVRKHLATLTQGAVQTEGR